MFEQEEANELQVNDVVMQEPAGSPTDSDYFSETEEDSPVDSGEDDNASDPVVCSVSDDWIELDLSTDSLRSLGFLSGRLISLLYYNVLKHVLMLMFIMQILIFKPCWNLLQSSRVINYVWESLVREKWKVKTIELQFVLFWVYVWNYYCTGLMRNHLAYLLWRRTVFTKLRQLPPITGKFS